MTENLSGKRIGTIYIDTFLIKTKDPKINQFFDRHVQNVISRKELSGKPQIKYVLESDLFAVWDGSDDPVYTLQFDQYYDQGIIRAIKTGS